MYMNHAKDEIYLDVFNSQWLVRFVCLTKRNFFPPVCWVKVGNVICFGLRDVLQFFNNVTGSLS